MKKLLIIILTIAAINFGLKQYKSSVTDKRESNSHSMSAIQENALNEILGE